MNKLTTEKRCQVVRCLVEGSSIRSTVRMTGVAKNTVVKLLVDLGTACAAYHDENVRNVSSNRIQCDEIWSFVYAKEKNVPTNHKGEFGFGDVWTWTALDADSKLMVSWMLGWRDGESAREFMKDVASRLANRVQITTDGHRAYLEAVEEAFGGDVDYAMLIKLYGEPREGQARYSPAECIGCKKTKVSGLPNKEHVSTSYVERANLTMRMTMRRFTRLTNGFSKKVENLGHQIAINFVYYNFVRIHQTLRMTPAMKAGVTKTKWEIEDMVALLDKSSN